MQRKGDAKKAGLGGIQLFTSNSIRSNVNNSIENRLNSL